MAQKHSSSTLGLQTFHLKGRTYRYKGAFSGQGGPTVHYYRRRRRKPSQVDLELRLWNVAPSTSAPRAVPIMAVHHSPGRLIK